MTIIDAEIAEIYLKKRFGGGEQGIYSVYKLVADFDLKLRNNYTGPTEFLVYAVVPSGRLNTQILAFTRAFLIFQQKQ